MMLHPHELMQIIRHCAAEIQQDRIRRTSMIRTDAAAPDRRDWRGPPLRPDRRLAGVSLDEVVRLFYGVPLTVPKILSTWDLAAQLLAHGRSAREIRPVLAAAVPGVPLAAPPGAGAEELMAQWLQVCAWEHGRFDIAAGRAILKLDQGEIGLDRKGLLRIGVYRRYRHLHEVRTWDALRMPLGRLRRGLTPTSAVYRYLLGELPDKQFELDVLFATAVAAGRAYETAIYELFDVVKLFDPVPPADSAWKQCRVLVETSLRNPTAQMYELLKLHIGYEAFKLHFGAPHRSYGSVYTARQRARHRAILDQIETGEISAMKLRLSGSPTGREVADLLDLQQLIGRT